MKKTIIAAMAITASAASAGAADIPGYSPSYPYPSPYPAPPIAVYGWIGPYLGFNVGGQWTSVTNSSANPTGIAGGAQVGYNWQTGQFVYGMEWDIQASSADDMFGAYKFSNPWFGTVRGRAGFVTFNNILLYGTIGLAYGGGHIEVSGFSESHTHVGWAIGAGIEWGFAPNWSAKAEYLFIDLFSQNYVLTGTNNGFESNLLRFGVNYRF